MYKYVVEYRACAIEGSVKAMHNRKKASKRQRKRGMRASLDQEHTGTMPLMLKSFISTTV